MVNPDNTIHSRIETKRSTDRNSADRPDGDAKPEKFREVYAVYEQKKPKDELEEIEELLRKKKKEGKGLSSLLEENGGGGSDTPVFNLNKESGSDSSEDLDKKLALIEEGLEANLADKPIKPGQKPAAFIREEPDIAQINPQAFQQDFNSPISAIEAKGAPQAPTRAQIQEIIDKIVDQVYKLESKKGETEIVIILNKEGPLKDVGIKVTETDTAKKELNITIDNLTQDAKALLEKSESQLLLALERKGYQVHMFTATTTIEVPRFDKSSERGEKGSQEDEPGQHQSKDENEERE